MRGSSLCLVEWVTCDLRHAQVGGWHFVNLIPFRLQGREGLGFLASVNLGLDAGTILALSAVVRGWSGTMIFPLYVKSFFEHHSIG